MQATGRGSAASVLERVWALHAGGLEPYGGWTGGGGECTDPATVKCIPGEAQMACNPKADEEWGSAKGEGRCSRPMLQPGHGAEGLGSGHGMKVESRGARSRRASRAW